MKRLIQMAAVAQMLVATTGIAWAAKKVAETASTFDSNFIIGALVLLAFYPLPTYIAFARKKSNKVAILALNLFVGWTVICWLIALIWSLTTDKVTVQHIYVQQPPPPPPA